MTIRALLVDDDPAARLAIRALLAAHPDIAIAGERRNGVEARRAIEVIRPDLVFLDPSVSDQDGFVPADPAGPVLVPTSDLRDPTPSLDAGGANHRLRPLDRGRFERALSLARERVEAIRRERERMLIVKDGRRTTAFDVTTVRYAESRRNYVRLDVGGTRILHREPLFSLARRLSPHGFRRVSRSLVVNPAHVRDVVPLPNGRFRLHLAGGAAVTTSRRFGPAIRDWLKTRSGDAP